MEKYNYKLIFLFLFIIIFYNRICYADNEINLINNIIENHIREFIQIHTSEKNKEIICYVTESFDEKNILRNTQINFKKIYNGTFEKLLTVETSDIFNKLIYYSVRENKFFIFHLVTGSGSKIIIFHYDDRKIDIVLEEDTQKSLPEIVDIDEDNFPEIFIKEIDDDAPFSFSKDGTVKIDSQYKKCKIFKWNGNSYKLERIVQWEKRFVM